MLGIFCVFVTSLSVFPALTVEMKSDHFLTHNGWYPLVMIVCLNSVNILTFLRLFTTLEKL